MRRTRALPLAALALAAVLLVVIAGGSSDSYEVRVQLESAVGLREGSEVKVGGVPSGTIKTLKIGKRDQIEATLALDPAKSPRIGRDARLEVVTSNLLGSKYLQLDPGDAGTPPAVPDTVDPSRVTYPTDLDQMLSTLDVDTRMRLRIVLNEAGYAITGRKIDFSDALEVLPRDLDKGGRVIGDIAADNVTLARLVRESSAYVTRLNSERGELIKLVDVAGEAAQATADKREQLAATIFRAPGALREARTFLGDLERTTVPLEPAAQAIANTAPALTETLASLPAFERAARPALRQARAVTPELDRVATQVRPVLQQALPTVRSLAQFSTSLRPVSEILDVSVDDLLAVLEGWGRAIQGRDRHSHIFHGRATFSPEVIRGILATALPATTKAKRRRTTGRPGTGTADRAPALGGTDGGRPAKTPDLPVLGDVLPNVTDGVERLLDDLRKPKSSPDKTATPLLDFLLGA